MYDLGTKSSEETSVHALMAASLDTNWYLYDILPAVICIGREGGLGGIAGGGVLGGFDGDGGGQGNLPPEVVPTSVSILLPN